MVGKIIREGDEWTSGGSVYCEPEEAALAYIESEAVLTGNLQVATRARTEG